MSPAMATDSASTFVVFLVVLLAVMIVAVFRAPRSDGSSPEDATRPLPAVPASPPPVPARSRSVPAHSRAAHPLAGVADAQAQAAAAIARAAAVLPARQPPGQQSGNTATMPPAGAASHGHARYPARHVAGTLPRPPVTGGPPWPPAPNPSEMTR
jgi:hypothetical protein